MSYFRRLGSSYPHICMSDISTDFQIKCEVPKEQAIRWLEFLKSQEPFEYEFNDPTWITIRLSSYEKSYRVMMGQLLKALNEHKSWMLPVLNDPSPKSFFNKCYKNFVEHYKSNSVYRYNFIADHTWFRIKYDYDSDLRTFPKKRYKVRTIKKLFEEYRKNPGASPIWKTYLGA